MNPDLQHSELSLSSMDLIALLRSVLATEAAVRVKVRGCSMNPFIKDGDIVTICPLGRRRIFHGDVAAFAHEGTDRLFIHRVLGVQGDSFLIKGDNADRSDGLIHRSQILGRITKVERNGCNVRIGLGQERRLIALFNRAGILSTLLKPARKVYGILISRWTT